MQDLVTITMSHEDWNSLVCYLLRNTKSRQGEIDAWESLSHEQNEDGSLTFPNAKAMMEYEIETRDTIERIEKYISNACCTPQISQPRMEEIATLLKDGLIEDDEEQAYIYFNEICDFNFHEANFFGLEFDKWEEYNEESIFDKENK